MGMKKMAAEAVEYLVVHCSATKSTQDIDVSDIDRWHRSQGWVKVGYHYVIKRDGSVQKGRADDEPGAHVQGFNSKSLGICLVGGVGEDGKAENNFTKVQLSTLAVLLNDLTTNFPKASIQGHRDFPGVHKDCPSFDVRSWWKTRTH